MTSTPYVLLTFCAILVNERAYYSRNVVMWLLFTDSLLPYYNLDGRCTEEHSWCVYHEGLMQQRKADGETRALRERDRTNRRRMSCWSAVCGSIPSRHRRPPTRLLRRGCGGRSVCSSLTGRAGSAAPAVHRWPRRSVAERRRACCARRRCTLQRTTISAMTSTPKTHLNCTWM